MKKELSNLPAGDERMLKITEWVLFLVLISILAYQLFTFSDNDFFAPLNEEEIITEPPVKQVSDENK